MVLWRRDRPSEEEITERANAIVQKKKVTTLSHQMVVHASLLQAQAMELKELLEREQC